MPEEPEQDKPELDTKYMRAYKERGQRDNKALIIVSLVVLVVFSGFAFWIVKRLDDNTSYLPPPEQALICIHSAITELSFPG